jgi:hypothetical protein
MNRKIIPIMLALVILPAIFFTGTIRAEDGIKPAVVTGKTYVCYFVCSLDVFNPQVTFDSNGGLIFSNFSGYGFYFTVTSLFMGSYVVIDGKIGTQTGDIVLLLVGASFEPTPFIAGTGLLIFNYTQTLPIVFTGFTAPESAE